MYTTYRTVYIYMKSIPILGTGGDEYNNRLWNSNFQRFFFLVLGLGTYLFLCTQYDVTGPGT